jgi:hypothetical protein
MPYGYSNAEFDYIDNEEDDNRNGAGCLILLIAPLYTIAALITYFLRGKVGA